MMRSALALLTVVFLASGANAQEVGALVTNNTGDTAWVLAASALVLMMTLPGLVLLYGGLVRSKNVLSVALQTGAVASIVSVLWIVVGYTLAFGDVGNGWFGNGRAWMLIELTNLRGGTTVPESTFVLFQMTFAMIAPALMIGAWVDRARFSWVVIFCALWSVAVYAPVAHWIWGGGWLASSFGTADFAGGLVVHTTAGVSALVVAVMMGRRRGFPDKPLIPHAPALTMVGAALLWVGWFGLTGGSAMAATDDASSAIINTHVAASVAALVWLLIERINFGKPTAIGWATGAVAGLATITPAAGYISPGAAILFGALAAVVCHFAVLQVRRWGIDDSLDVFAVHGVGGILGSLLLGLFMSSALGGTGYPEGVTPAGQLGAQALGVAAVALWSAVLTGILALAINIFSPMRVKKKHEMEGLDISSHGERGWHFTD
ncbi:ammonium transporter [Alteriqipengyuania lutimaris]|uniref:Ammonium transporter n=1 Tax=Alteriqipengyuania lutimaris TaxID=1538146 RepID=A0A395LM61_9SPHN|nr:ammonium transporter [Alteriqipengyuania lutimaris]MBB3032775.1 Amt family ammonium transporter [Alteriqipengyuania lutimaris]RDS78123.1 ammonium transporter [Alteriqipengyuania lutimaris]